jgi:hypothetical protein
VLQFAGERSIRLQAIGHASLPYPSDDGGLRLVAHSWMPFGYPIAFTVPNRPRKSVGCDSAQACAPGHFFARRLKTT